MHKESKYEVAIKTISLKDKDFSEANAIEHEIHLMQLSVHNTVVRLLDSFRSRDEFHMILDWERGGTLKNYLSERNQLLKDARAREIA